MSSKVWESIDDLFAAESEKNNNKKTSSNEVDELDQNELIGIIDDEDYQYFLTTEKIDEDDYENKTKEENVKIKHENLIESTSNQHSKVIDKNIDEVDDLTKPRLEIQNEINSTEKKYKINIDDDEDDNENEFNIRDKFWSERSKDDFTSKLNEDESVLEDCKSKIKIPDLMEKKVISSPNFNEKKTQQLPLIQIPPPPLIYINFDSYNHQPSQKINLNDIELIRQTFLLNNQQNCYLNTPLYTDFSSNQQQKLKIPNKIEKKRKSDVCTQQQQQQQQQQNAVNNELEIVKPIETSILEGPTPNKIVKNTTDESQKIESDDVNKIIADIDPEYLKKLEQQKKIREAILKKKEERRLQQAQEDKFKNNDDKTVNINKENKKVDMPNLSIPPLLPQPPKPLISFQQPAPPRLINRHPQPLLSQTPQFITPVRQPFKNFKKNYIPNINLNNKLIPGNGIYENPLHFYATTQINRPQNLFQTPNYSQIIPNNSQIYKNNQQQMTNLYLNISQPQHLIKCIIQNLSLNTTDKCILNLCNNIRVRDKVVKLNMFMNENKAEIMFSDRDSAEKFFQHYNRTLVELSIINIKIV